MNSQPNNPSKSNAARWAGVGLALAGLAINRWSLAWFLTADRSITSTTTLTAIVVTQAILVLAGVFLLVRPPALARAASGLATALLLAVTGLGGFGTLRALGIVKTANEDRLSTQIARMNASETLHLNLGGRLKKLSAGLLNLQVPDWQGLGALRPEVSVRELDGTHGPELYHDFEDSGVLLRKWHIEEGERTVPAEELDLLSSFLDRMSYVKKGKFYFVGGDFVGDDFSQWEVRAGFSAFGHLEEGGWAKAKGSLVIRWKLDESHDPNITAEFEDFDAWSISRLAFSEFKTYESENILFEEVLDSAIPDAQALATARRNQAQEMVVDMVKADLTGGTWEPPHPFFSAAAASENPSVSVIDINRDGFDDFYTMPRYGPNQLFVNNGDGTFREAAAQYGLDFEDFCTVALFADFDNDDDDDLFLGRSLARSMFLENDGGRFVDRTEKIFGDEAPYFAMTASAADIDNDGLLDLYIGTYAATLLVKDLRAKRRAGDEREMLFADYLPEGASRELFRRHKTSQTNHVRDRVGPPNYLLRNTGDLSFAAENSPVNIYRNTYQAGFADFDGDGDQDVYLANDFSPNSMFRNEGGEFVDVTEATNAADIGFGMGVSWGDFDRDGDHDAYISNMFSKAGNRILPMVEAVDKTFLRMAGGNSLLELQDGRFERVSSLDGPGYHVEYGGWSWGSQFVDVDNDAWLDLYALSGYYSAPKEIGAGHDL